MFLLTFSLALVGLGMLLRSTQDDVLQTCGYWCYLCAVVIAVVLASVNCSSPTAPSCTPRNDVVPLGTVDYKGHQTQASLQLSYLDCEAKQ